MMLLSKRNFVILLFSVVLYINGINSFKIETPETPETHTTAEEHYNKAEGSNSLNDNSNEQVVLIKNDPKHQLELLQQQRPELKEFVEALLSNLESRHEHDDEDLNEIEMLEDPEISSSELRDEDGDEDLFFSSFKPKRSADRFKKEFGEKRNKSIRRQQAAKWDIGFGKRGASSLGSYHMKPKSFLDALYGKRSAKNNKVTFGRKQQWDIRYGK